jgi:hypothetical protein
MDPDPHQGEKSDPHPDPHQGDNSNPGPHQGTMHTKHIILWYGTVLSTITKRIALVEY